MPSSYGLKKRRKGSSLNASTSTSSTCSDADWKQSRVLRCSYKVLQLIGDATLTEKVIRESLGNNPDTSKALRLLVKRKMLKRVGFGGRSCPFHYQLCLNRQQRPTSELALKEEFEKMSTIKTEIIPDKCETVADGQADEVAAVTDNDEDGNAEEDDEPPELPQKKKQLLAPKLEIKEPKLLVPKLEIKEPRLKAAKAEPGREIPVPGWRLISD